LEAIDSKKLDSMGELDGEPWVLRRDMKEVGDGSAGEVGDICVRDILDDVARV
jgi:hypothetical protein